MIPKETKEFFSIPKRHTLAFVIGFSPVIIGVVVSSILYRFTFAYSVPALWGFFVCLILIDALKKGRLSDNHGTAIRSQTPVRFWAKFAIWSVFYMFAIAWCIGFALQEQKKLQQHAPGALSRAITSQVDAECHRRGAEA